MTVSTLTAPRPTSDEAAETREARTAAALRTAHDAPSRERRRLEQTIVMEHLGVADAVARRYQGRPEDQADLRQVAYVGLVKAVRRFDPARGKDLVSFAVPTISGEIKRYLRDSTWAVRPPRPVQELHSDLSSRVPRLAQRLGREPTVAEIAADAGADEGQVAQALACASGRRPVSLDAPRGDDEDGRGTLGDSLRAPDGDFAHTELSVALTSACRALTARERRILYLRFFEEQTQSRIAAECGVTQMQISRILAKILRTLRERLAPDLMAA